MIRRTLLCLLCASSWAASDPPPAEPRPPASAQSKKAAERVSFRRVTAWSPQGNGNGPSEWRAVVDGRESRVLRARGPHDDLLLFVVLDLTGDLTLVESAKRSASAEIEKLPPGNWVGVLRSQDGLRVLADPSADRKASSTAIENAPVSGRAGLLETIEAAAGLGTRILRKAPARAAILYLTDSNIYNYREDYTNPVINPSDYRDLSRRFPEVLVREKTSKLADTLAEFDAPVFIVHLLWLRDRLNEAYQTGLQQMAEATGGEAIFCRAAGDIPNTLAQAFERIRGMWAVDVEIPSGTPRNFTVLLSADGAQLQHRARFATRANGKE